MLRNKSITELRGIAQAFGIADIFTKDAIQLAQEIEAKQNKDFAPPAPIVSAANTYDARLMTKPPSKRSDVESAQEVLAPFVSAGLHVRYDDERWYMSYQGRQDEGTLRMPLRVLIKCAERIMKPVGKDYKCSPKDGQNHAI